MTFEQESDKAQQQGGNGKNRAVDSAILLWVARVIMPTVIGAAITIGGYMLKRGLDALDAHGTKIDVIGTQQATVIEKIESFNQQLADHKRANDSDVSQLRRTADDHETRIRVLERTK